MSRHASTRAGREAMTTRSKERSMVQGFGRTQKAGTPERSNARTCERFRAVGRRPLHDPPSTQPGADAGRGEQCTGHLPLRRGPSASPGELPGVRSSGLPRRGERPHPRSSREDHALLWLVLEPDAGVSEATRPPRERRSGGPSPEHGPSGAPGGPPLVGALGPPSLRGRSAALFPVWREDESHRRHRACLCRHLSASQPRQAGGRQASGGRPADPLG